jgi:hypothetical protein
MLRLVSALALAGMLLLAPVQTDDRIVPLSPEVVRALEQAAARWRVCPSTGCAQSRFIVSDTEINWT